MDSTGSPDESGVVEDKYELMSERQLSARLDQLEKSGVFNQDSAEARVKSVVTPAIQVGYLNAGEVDFDPNVTFCETVQLFFSALGSLLIPKIKTSWEEEINSGGRTKSIVAFVSVFLLTLLAGFGFLTAFSRVEPFWGEADETFIALDGKADYAFILGLGSGGVIVGIYVFDFVYGGRLQRITGFILFILAVIGLSVALLFVEGTGGIAPLAVFCFWVPLVLSVLKVLVFPTVNSSWYMLGVFIPLLLMSVGVASLWIIWVFYFDKYWSEEETKQEYFLNVGCDFDAVSSDVFRNSTTPCSSAFLVWVSPIFLAVYCFIFMNWLAYIIRSINKVKNPNQKEKKQNTRERFLRFLIILFSVGVFGTWVAASLFTDQFISMEASVLVIAIEAGLTAFVLYALTFGFENIKKTLVTSPLGIKLIAFAESDWANAFLVFFLTPFVLVYMMLSFITQSIRKHTKLGKKIESEQEREMMFKIESQFIIEKVKSWEYGSVTYKVIWIGIFWFLCVVGIGRMANVFLSWLNEVLTVFSLVETSAIMTAAGVGMFMLPPMPGLPIYLTVGLVVSRSAELEGYPFFGAAWISVGVGSLIKMLAICVQTKIIGTWIGSRSAYIRSVCAVNSIELRAMKKIMSANGWTVPKVAVLVGGPDWPTSVLTGIMRLKLRQMLLGSLPVLITIVPVSFAGAALLKKDEETFAALGPLLLSVGVVVQLTPFFIAIHYIAKAAVENQEELENEELDKEVEEYDKVNELKRKWTYYLNMWDQLAPWVRVLHVIMAIIGTVGNLMLFIFGNLAFESFDVTDTIDEKLDGNLANIIKKPFGYLFLSMVGIPFLYVFIYSKVQSRRVKFRVDNGYKLDDDEIPNYPAISLSFISLDQFVDKARVDRINNLRQRLKKFSFSAGRASARRTIGRITRRASAGRRSNRRSNRRGSADSTERDENDNQPPPPKPENANVAVSDDTEENDQV